ncbi:MAG: nascent polypeptide-associated complex protein [Candidatus Pacearchaeota archaeon]
MFNLDPKKMASVMKQMGIAQEDIPSSRVIIEKEDGSRITITEPSVAKIKMQGQESFQISGNVSEEQGFSNNDIKTLMEQTGCSEAQAQEALEKTNDLVEAIMLLKK